MNIALEDVGEWYEAGQPKTRRNFLWYVVCQMEDRVVVVREEQLNVMEKHYSRARVQVMHK